MGTPLQFKRDPFVFAIWLVVLGGLGFFFYKERIGWEALIACIVLLGLPSMLMKGREGNERERKTDRPATIVLPKKDE